ncbi:hypothetical protein TZ02_05415 [Clostridium aceticum]|nr:ComEA family DNA-binding protein [Clostridium aceticum]KJF28208.1 hypothetical protein TZ02_05415 [Clostridium aceticum]
MTFKLNDRQKLIIIIFIVIVLAFVSYTNHLKSKKEIYILSESRQQTVVEYERDEEEQKKEINEKIKVENNTIIVHVEGAVAQPGVYELPQEARVFNAIEAAGGLKNTADRREINLAKKISDEEKIYIPVEGESFSNVSLNQQMLSTPSISSNVSSTGININTATKEELETLPGVGSVLAQRIIDHRNEKGFFQSIEELQSVSGIGEKKYSDIKDKITIR